MLVSAQIVVYLFLGGASGGMLLFSCLWSVVFRTRAGYASCSVRMRLAFDTFFARCVVVGAVLMLVSILCLFWDLGRPDRVLALVLTSAPNVLTLGAVCLGAELVASCALAALLVFDLPAPRLTRTACEGAIAVVSFAVILYTGVYLYSMEAVAFWHTPALLAVFFFSSLSSGLSLMLLIAYFSQDQASLLGAVRPMQRLHLALLVCEAASIVWFVAAGASNPAAQKSVELLLGSSMLPTAAVGVAGMALVLPFALESLSLASRSHRNIPASDAICLVGGFALRYCVIACGLH